MRRLSVKSNATTSEQGFALRSLLRDNISSLETALDEACEALLSHSRDSFHHIKKLHVDVQLDGRDLKDKATFFSALKEQLHGQIENKIMRSLQSGSSSSELCASNGISKGETIGNILSQQTETPLQLASNSVSGNALDALFYYLHNGVLPWYSLPNEGLDEAIKRLSDQPKLISYVNQKVSALHSRRRWIAFLLDVYNEQSSIIETLLHHSLIDKKTDVQLCKKVLSSQMVIEDKIEMLALLTNLRPPNLPADLTRQLRADIHGSDNNDKALEATLFAKWLLDSIKYSNNDVLSPTQIIRKANIIEGTTHQSVANMSGSERYGSDKNKQNEVLLRVNNAGLVLFYAYFPRLFSRQQWLDAEKNIKPKCLHVAAKSLAYLCSGKSTIADHQATIIKVLLGLNIEDVLLVDKQTLSPELIEELNSLTTSFIAHWQTLGNTSITGFRGSFIKREAILKAFNNTWQMTVERQAIDVLIESLPFSISTVKLPWMTLPLHLTW